MAEYIEKNEVLDICGNFTSMTVGAIRGCIERIRPADVVEIPETGIGDLSDGYHTFNGLYWQRAVLFAALVKAYKDKSWKSMRHEDGELCFGGGWFIVGIDTPEGSYTYHYETKDWSMFDCEELQVGKHWDGHTEKDVTRLLSLQKEREEDIAHVVIEVKGGMVQTVYADRSTDVDVADLDTDDDLDLELALGRIDEAEERGWIHVW